MNHKQRADFMAWMTYQPECIRNAYEAYSPWKLYIHKPSNYTVTIKNYFVAASTGEITFEIEVSKKYNEILSDYKIKDVSVQALEATSVELTEFGK